MARVSTSLDLDKVEASGFDCIANAALPVLCGLWHALHHDDKPSPAKRRKLSHVDPSEEAQVCLADVTVDLPLDNASALYGHLEGCCKHSGGQPVILNTHHRIRKPTSAPYTGAIDQDPRVIQLNISQSSSANDPFVDLTCTSDPRDDILPHLRNVGLLSSLKPGACPVWAQSTISIRLEHGRGILQLHSKIWYAVDQSPSPHFRRLCSTILSAYCPDRAEDHSIDWTPQDFYNSIHVPDPKRITPNAIQHPDVEAQLYPFQHRTVQWLLTREHRSIGKDGRLADIIDTDAVSPLSFQTGVDAHGGTYYASSLLLRVLRGTTNVSYLHQQLRGGILAEEVGLGKTLELIDLICLNKRFQGLGTTTRDTYTATDVLVSGATLIISPVTILDQWYNEIRRHAPSLKVMRYDKTLRYSHGIRKRLAQHDIVLTTYNVLTSEIHYADEPKQRRLRHQKKYVALRSPLVEILWWRVCLDEAQMIESSVNAAAIVARRIPRCNAWAVTGTPLKKDAADLMGLLVFLRYEPFTDLKTWERLIGRHRDLFQHIFGTICLRHTKAQVRGDLQLPRQQRVVVTVPFSAIEENHYLQMYENMCDAVRVDREGVPLHGDWDPNVAADAMRTWLTRLRQTCLHPEVGERNRKALGRRTGPLGTVEEVLEVMIDQNETSLRSEERNALMARVLQGHLHAFSNEPSRAAALYEDALSRTERAVAECRDYLAQQKGKHEAKCLQAKEEGESEREGEAGDEKSERLNICRQRLRLALELQHLCAFFAATSYFQLSDIVPEEEKDSPEYKRIQAKEAELYEKAKAVRQELSQEVTIKTTSLMDKVLAKVAVKGLIPEVQSFRNMGGIESRRIMASVDDIRDMLNEQGNVLISWRHKLLGLLAQPLLDQDETELSGEEYEATLKQQDEAYVYQFALRALVSDRAELLTGQKNFLLQHETQEALKQAEKGDGHAPLLMKAVLKMRQDLRYQNRDDVNLRGLAADLRSLVVTVKHTTDSQVIREAEASLAQEELENLQAVIAEQAKVVPVLERELDLFRNAESARLEFYRQLQTISDTVRPYAEEMSENIDKKKLDEAVKTEHTAETKLSKLRTRSRYLTHLRQTTVDPASRRPCIVCKELFEDGVLTICAHEFCKECITHWLGAHRTCPTCKQPLQINDLHNITYKVKHVRAEEENGDGSPSSSGSDPTAAPSTSSIYSSISQQTLDDIKSIDLPCSWGSKIDTIARHIIHLRVADPGSKAVIFSQYRDFLHLFGNALRTFKVGCTNITDKGSIKRFQEDPSVECLLLDAKSQSSGLNLTNATHVFLCEPLVNVAIELQAIARVHRIGQTKPTTVWQYIVSDTVEEQIYDMSVSRRLQHVRGSGTHSRAQTPAAEDTESKLDAANSKAMQSAPLLKLLANDKSGGERVAEDDLWKCLFGKASRRVNEEAGFAALEAVAGRELRAGAAEIRRQT